MDWYASFTMNATIRGRTQKKNRKLRHNIKFWSPSKYSPLITIYLCKQSFHCWKHFLNSLICISGCSLERRLNNTSTIVETNEHYIDAWLHLASFFVTRRARCLSLVVLCSGVVSRTPQFITRDHLGKELNFNAQNIPEVDVLFVGLCEGEEQIWL